MEYSIIIILDTLYTYYHYLFKIIKQLTKSYVHKHNCTIYVCLFDHTRTHSQFKFWQRFSYVHSLKLP